MSEALRLVVAIVVDGTFLVFRAIVVCQLQHTFPRGHRIWHVFFKRSIPARVSQEIQVKAGVFEPKGTHQLHAHAFGVELQALLDILDTQHGVVETVRRYIGSRDLRLDALVSVSPDDLDPVPVRVLDKCNVIDTAFAQFLLEGISSFLETVAGKMDVVYRDGCMAKASVWLGVAIDYGIVGVILRAMIVC